MRKYSILGMMAITIFVAVMFSVPATAQTGKLPPFRMMLANGKLFKAEDLPIGKPIIIIYFSPECDHCQKLMKELFKRTAELKKASIAMITYLPVDKVVAFQKLYGVNRYSNIYAGTEGSSFFVKNYYKLMEMPFAALYSKNGDFIKSYSREIDLNDLSKRLKKLN